MHVMSAQSGFDNRHLISGRCGCCMMPSLLFPSGYLFLRVASYGVHRNYVTSTQM